MASHVTKLPRFKYDKDIGHIDNHPKGRFTSFKVSERIILQLENKITELYKEIALLEENQCDIDKCVITDENY